MNLLNNYTGLDNFWKLNPQLKIVDEFSELYNKDKTRDKQESSRIMYALCFLIDPTEDNKFSNLKEEDRKTLIAKDYLKEANFAWDKYNKQIEKLKELMLTPLERNLLNFKIELDKRDTFLNNYKWNIVDGFKKDKMLANTADLHKIYKSLLESIRKEKIETRDKGGQMPSASDLGTM